MASGTSADGAAETARITPVAEATGQSGLNLATLAEQVYEHLRQGILANEYQPGTVLREEALAGRLKVSRVPVREAVRRLASEGLVTVTPRQGAAVSTLSPRQFLDAYRVREALEALAIRLAVPRLTPEDVARLDQLHEEMARHAAADDAVAFFAANAAFHALFVERADNEYLRAIYLPLMDQMRRYLSPSLDLRGGMDRSIEEHRAILRAVRAGDGAEAARLLGEHSHVPQRILEAAEAETATPGDTS